MNHGICLSGLMTVALSVGSQVQAVQEKTRPNVLFIGFDDLRPLLGCYGDPVAITPNLDRFAERSMRFTRAHVQQAVCTASRASFLTGCRPASTGVHYPYSEYFVTEFMPKHPTLMTRFMQEGYFSQTFGKIHHGYDETLSAPKFDNWAANRYILPENRGRPQKENEPFEHPDVEDNAYADAQIAEATIAALKTHVASRREQPFFFSTGFYKPHLPWSCPKKYHDLYKTAEMPLALVKELPVNGLPYALAHFALGKFAGPDPADGILTDERARQMIHSYYATVSYADAQFGKVIDELDRLGLMDNTVIVVWSDHGWHLGDQGMWGKSANFHLDTHVPLMVYAPGMQTAGQISEALVEYVDLYPTLTELTGLETPDYLEGTSLVPLLEQPDRKWKSAVFFQFPRWHQSVGHVEGFGIQTDRYRYIEWRKREKGGPIGEVTGRELYDHGKDPQEGLNAADLPEYKPVVEEMSARLWKGWKAALPPGTVNRSNLPPAPPVVKWSGSRE